MSHRLRISIITTAAVALLVSAGLVASYELKEPPLSRLREAMDSLESARAARAELWAGDVYKSAQDYLHAGWQSMAEVNSSWWPFRSYRVADSLLGESIRLSQLASFQAENSQVRRRGDIESEVANLRDSLGVWRDMMDYALPRTENELLYRSASFNQRMAESLLKKNQHEAARGYADSVRVVLGALENRYEQHLSSSRQWIEKSHAWAAQTAEISRASGSAALIVDKSKHRLYVLTSGRVTDSLTCELGYNSGHQKRTSGDGATPEGMYRVTKVNEWSKYYRALLLDYPNADDKERFRTNLEAGVIPANSKMGGLIEIHGHGGQGRDWTDGCVAVTDAEMDRLLRVATAGTPVTIVRVWEIRQ